MLALYVGGMGPRGKNFYFDLASRLGYASAAEKIQDAFLDGRKAEASALVPDALLDEVALVGPPERVADQLQAWKESKVTTLCLRTTDVSVIETMRSLV
jgi:alkanesulfonate monooxygenase SsuD/methylene tetrahydromethanopterin reductase-like flavin-dependent oxidoreductase (luciferase family)